MTEILQPQTIDDEVNSIVDQAAHVSINEAELAKLAQRMKQLLTGEQRQHAPAPLSPDEVPMANDRDTLQYYLMRRSQSFTIWRWTEEEQQPVEAWDCHVNGHLYTGERAVNACIKRAIDNGVPLLDPSYLETITLEELEDIYRDEATGEVTYQLLDLRLEKLHEIGRVLKQKYDGHMVNLLELADGRLFRDDGNGVVQRLVADFPKSFGDEPFAKLAVTLMYQLHNRKDVDIPTTEEYLRLTRIDDPENSIGPTDYYIPLFLARWGVFELSEEMTEVLTQRKLIDRGSTMEREFRAATLRVFDSVREITGISLAELDHEFWYQGAFRCRPCFSGATQEEVPCPIRDACEGFQRKPSLMRLGWPLVYTPYY